MKGHAGRRPRAHEDASEARAHNLSQDQLAAKLFVTRQAVSPWERGEVTSGIDTTKLIATCECFSMA